MLLYLLSSAYSDVPDVIQYSKSSNDYPTNFSGHQDITFTIDQKYEYGKAVVDA